jgi:hypothetical protein
MKPLKAGAGRKRKLRRHAQIRRKKRKNWCQVYVLREKDGETPFYVGQTRSLAEERLRWHVIELSPVQRHIQAMRHAGNTPIIQIIDHEGQWDISEAVWIDRLIRDGAKLLNILSRVPQPLGA